MQVTFSSSSLSVRRRHNSALPSQFHYSHWRPTYSPGAPARPCDSPAFQQRRHRPDRQSRRNGPHCDSASRWATEWNCLLAKSGIRRLPLRPVSANWSQSPWTERSTDVAPPYADDGDKRPREDDDDDALLLRPPRLLLRSRSAMTVPVAKRRCTSRIGFERQLDHLLKRLLGRRLIHWCILKALSPIIMDSTTLSNALHLRLQHYH